jgi:hypothetical protein
VGLHGQRRSSGSELTATGRGGVPHPDGQNGSNYSFTTTEGTFLEQECDPVGDGDVVADDEGYCDDSVVEPGDVPAHRDRMRHGARVEVDETIILHRALQRSRYASCSLEPTKSRGLLWNDWVGPAPRGRGSVERVQGSTRRYRGSPPKADRWIVSTVVQVQRHMGWKHRYGGCYYYRNERQGDRVVKRYYGAGLVGSLAARLDAKARNNREQPLRAIGVLVARLGPPDAALNGLSNACNLLLEATLLIHGFHRPNYGAWRRRRVPNCRIGKLDPGS